MPDSIYPANLPAGYPAYLGYVDGDWPTLPELKTRFPGAYHVGLTVTGSTLHADGIDVEPGNPGAVTGVAWAARKLHAEPASRPVIYASVTGTPGYGMHDVLRELGAQGILRAEVRLLSAHYWGPKEGPHQKHICGPATCNLISEPMDGTQWTDKATGSAHDRLVDMSEVLDSFFTQPAPSPPEDDTVQLPNVPGTWLIAHQVLDTQTQVEYVVGLGTSGRVYMTKRAPGETGPPPP